MRFGDVLRNITAETFPVVKTFEKKFVKSREAMFKAAENGDQQYCMDYDTRDFTIEDFGAISNYLSAKGLDSYFSKEYIMVVWGEGHSL